MLYMIYFMFDLGFICDLVRLVSLVGVFNFDWCYVEERVVWF